MVFEVTVISHQTVPDHTAYIYTIIHGSQFNRRPSFPADRRLRNQQLFDFFWYGEPAAVPAINNAGAKKRRPIPAIKRGYREVPQQENPRRQAPAVWGSKQHTAYFSSMTLI